MRKRGAGCGEDEILHALAVAFFFNEDLAMAKDELMQWDLDRAVIAAGATKGGCPWQGTRFVVTNEQRSEDNAHWARIDGAVAWPVMWR